MINSQDNIWLKDMQKLKIKHKKLNMENYIKYQEINMLDKSHKHLNKILLYYIYIKIVINFVHLLI